MNDSFIDMMTENARRNEAELLDLIRLDAQQLVRSGHETYDPAWELAFWSKELAQLHHETFLLEVARIKGQNNTELIPEKEREASTYLKLEMSTIINDLYRQAQAELQRS